MPMPHELDAEAWLTSYLTADSTLTAACPGGVHMHPAPHTAKTPLITYQPIPGPDTMTVPGERIMVSGTWRVAIWFEHETPGIRAAIRHLDELLHQALGVENGHRVRVHRERSWSSATAPTSGDLIYAIGGWYRFDISL